MADLAAGKEQNLYQRRAAEKVPLCVVPKKSVGALKGLTGVQARPPHFGEKCLEVVYAAESARLDHAGS